MIYTIIITLLVVGIVLFIFSFFTNDKIKELEEQIEELSVTTLKESYQMKKKINILEEELLTDIFTEEPHSPNFASNEKLPPIYAQIKKMYDVGFSMEEIAKNTSLKIYDIKAILKQLYPEMKEEGEA